MTAASIEAVGDNKYLVSGPLQFDSVPELWKTSMGLINGASPLVLDLEKVTRTDSAALALLLEWMREARRRELEIHFKNIPDQMLANARASRLEHLLP